MVEVAAFLSAFSIKITTAPFFNQRGCTGSVYQLCSASPPFFPQHAPFSRYPSCFLWPRRISFLLQVFSPHSKDGNALQEGASSARVLVSGSVHTCTRMHSAASSQQTRAEPISPLCSASRSRWSEKIIRIIARINQGLSGNNGIVTRADTSFCGTR